ncbi:hypothetical protein [Cellulomonas soli]|uniref:Uncharacterized protein n=1 Tax=Cellulomonas soli TaxID=931535 RepID=A0A512PHP8_9CELL|nr:hypothetical protein [Cellulomonas soli]NYI59211.1 hypothetical protein [Cellulomonas soli]GEP70716.1 hypothetical protein CSO01_34310 [Cellulomonas soli]
MTVPGWGPSVQRPSLTVTSDASADVVRAAAVAALSARRFAVSERDGTTLQARRVQWWNLTAQTLPAPVVVLATVTPTADGTGCTTSLTVTQGKDGVRVASLIRDLVDDLVARVRRTGADVRTGQWESAPREG